MTFYWWSHWFWITVMSNLIFPLIVVVHTYPSPESILEYNHQQTDNNNKLVTRLYQTSTVTWTTDIPNYGKSTIEEKLKLQNVEEQKTIEPSDNTENPLKQENEPTATNNNEEEEGGEYYDYFATEDNLEQMEMELENKEKDTNSENKEEHAVDVKRSAEEDKQQSKAATTLDPKAEMKLLDSSTPGTVVETNNYTNYTDSQHITSTNTTANEQSNAALTNTTTNYKNTSDSTATNTTTQTLTATSLSSTNNATTTTTTQLPQAPATPKIVKAQIGNLDWFNTVAAQLPPAHVTTDVTQDFNDEPHKIPFTLENVNKPEDLRREENEHRSRKSKGLSAEYKVNRYINYSSDSKNLLTRSAATTVNEYESEERSEALSVQRAYFMDVGAISAICFTVFGICCTVGTVGIVLYRRRFLNKPQALSEPDSSVYIDDSTMRVSDNSDEMYSLDNDSFLNSLEAMTIQNYWTDTVKHTKL
ncbi:Y' element ATP-dependent helicase YJL225C isoform X2 [Lucilia sericata]|uniref:Y' element ATP-dependent helicase YJL225C isoform X2 n=1 Tax=Lucilia sericata TaxID=13632 RepID=UPI0018A82A68|nr:Y' element ATP-dependent helicase YJL225C isoform X2 [Lucilia sericata]XP_037812962.1 Y' element ATP-dependent helicase YJL225C isoform X2 [Lucilia sericata]